jgi:hypothetical protein
VAHLSDNMPELLDRLSSDCADLDVVPPTIVSDRALSGLAGSYIVLGSQMGVAVMRNRAAEAGIDPMPRFFTPIDRRTAWADVCARLRDISTDSTQATDLIEDTRAGYALYAQAGALTLGKSIE